MKAQIRMRMVMAVLTLALLAGGEAWGQSRFDGSTDSKWTTAANWTPEAVPTASSNVVIGTTNAAVGATGSPMTATIGSGDTCASASLTLGEHAGNSGTLNMDGGTLTFPAAGNITVAGQASSTGVLNQTGGTLSGITSGTLTIGSGANGVGSITLGNNSSITSAVVIASATGASGTFTLTNNARWVNTTSADRNIGSEAGAAGSLNVYGNGYVDLANKGFNFGTAWGSTGILRVADNGVITNSAWYLRIGNPGYGDAVVSGTGKVHVLVVELCSTGGVPCSLTVRDSGYVKGLNLIGGGTSPTTGGQDGIATVTLSNNATVDGWGGQWTVVGAAARSTGRLYVRDNAVLRLTSGLAIGGGDAGGVTKPNNRTGIVEVSGYGVITNAINIFIGNNGAAEMTVSGTGKVYATAVEMNSTGGVACALTVRDSGYVGGLYKIGNSDNIATVTLSNNATVTGWSGVKTAVGSATRSTGRLYVRDNAVFGFASATPVYIGEGVNSTGIVEIAGSGAFTNCSALSVGYGAGSVGRLDLLGGKLHQAGAMNIGTVAGSTGIVSVANCAQTNITGAVAVGGGGTVGDRYGSVTVSNASFGGTAAMTVLTNGFVELTGTGSVLRCSTFTCRGGTVTNHVQKLAGGLDITGATLVITNGGKVHLSFEEDPVVAGDFWGLRWKGNNRAGQLQAMRDSGALTWSDAALYHSYKGVGIYTNATDTFVGVYVEKIVPRGMLLMVQ